MSEKVKQKQGVKRMSMISSFIVVFCELGLDGTSMRSLAASIDVSESLLYRYFENKEDIIWQCTALYHEQVLKELCNIFAKYIDKPDEMAEKTLEYIDRVIDICRFLFQGMAHTAYCKMMESTKRLSYVYMMDAARLFQEKIGIDEEMAMGAVALLVNTVDGYILKRSRASFLTSFRMVERMVLGQTTHEY